MALNPHQKNKIDVSALNPEEQKLFRLYGKLPSKTDHLTKQLKERKYFDSGDYALSKSSKANAIDAATVGSEHPLPENIPHLSSPGVGGANGGAGNGNMMSGAASGGGMASGSPVKESSLLYRETSADDVEQDVGRGSRFKDETGEQMSPSRATEDVNMHR